MFYSTRRISTGLLKEQRTVEKACWNCFPNANITYQIWCFHINNKINLHYVKLLSIIPPCTHTYSCANLEDEIISYILSLKLIGSITL